MRGVVFVEGVVELEGLVVQVLADAVHLQLAVVYHHQGVQTGHRVIIVAANFLLTDGTFAHTDADFHVFVVDPMTLLDGRRGAFAVRSNHTLKVDISRVASFPVPLFFRCTIDLHNQQINKEVKCCAFCALRSCAKETLPWPAPSLYVVHHVHVVIVGFQQVCWAF